MKVHILVVAIVLLIVPASYGQTMLLNPQNGQVLIPFGTGGLAPVDPFALAIWGSTYGLVNEERRILESIDKRLGEMQERDNAARFESDVQRIQQETQRLNSHYCAKGVQSLC